MHEQLIKLPKKVLTKAIVIGDEGHLLTEKDLSMLGSFYKSRRLICVSATFGGPTALKRLEDFLSKKV